MFWETFSVIEGGDEFNFFLSYTMIKNNTRYAYVYFKSKFI